jgi:hypothetical protein
MPAAAPCIVDNPVLQTTIEQMPQLWTEFWLPAREGKFLYTGAVEGA